MIPARLRERNGRLGHRQCQCLLVSPRPQLPWTLHYPVDAVASGTRAPCAAQGLTASPTVVLVVCQKVRLVSGLTLH